MKVRCFGLAIMCVAMTSVAFPQDCPQWGDDAAALKYLQENKANSTTLNPVCVNRAFSTLSQTASHIESLVSLLDFERSIEKDHSLKGVPSKYPAVGALTKIGKPAIPRLIRAIKESDSELIRTNATHALDGMYRSCEKELLDKLESEATKPETPPAQQEKLREAEKYVQDRHGTSPCKQTGASSAT